MVTSVSHQAEFVLKASFQVVYIYIYIYIYTYIYTTYILYTHIDGVAVKSSYFELGLKELGPV